MSLYTLTVDLLAKTGSFQTDMGRAAREADTSMKRMAASVNRGTASIASSFAGLAGGLTVGAVFATVVRNTVEAQQEMAQLNAVLRSTGEAAGYNSMQLVKMADTMAQATTHSAGEIVKAQTRLLSYSSIVGEQFPRALQMAIDQSARLGEGIEQSAETIGKALEKPSQGVTALTKQGFQFEESQKKVMKALEGTGRLAEAQTMVLDVMSESYEGAAKAARDTFGGSVTGLKNTINDLLTGDTGGDGLRGATTAVNDLTTTLNDPAVVEGFGQIVSGAMQAVTWLAQFASTTASVTAFLGEEIAARVHGAHMDDTIRINDRIGRLQETITALNNAESSFGFSVFNAKELQPGDLLRQRSTVVARLQGEITKEQEKLRMGEELRAAVAGPLTTSPAAAAAVRPLPVVLSDKEEAERKRRSQAADAEQKRRTESVAKYSREADLAAAVLAGPLAEAETKHSQRMADLNRLLKDGNISREAFNVLENDSARALASTTAELLKRQGAPQALLDTMSGELAMMGMIGPARERYRREMQNQHDMQRAINDANQAGAGIGAEMAGSLMAQARAAALASIDMEQYASQLQAWADIGTYAISDVADAFADFTASGMRDWGNLWDGMKDVARQGLRDIARQLLEQKLVVPIQARITNAVNGWGSQGGMSWESIQGIFGGNGSAAGGQSVTNVAGILSKGQGVFGGGAASSGAGSMMGFGNNLASFTGSGGAAATGAASGAGGAATGALGAAAAFAPYAALIAMGMQMAGSAYKDGFGLENQNKMDLLNRGHLASGGLLTPVMLDSMSLDYIGRALGMSSKTAAVFSGSSLLGKAFGRSAPKVTGQGITGDYGFDGLAGQSYADVKQKGGWFRSDKKWTQYGAMDPGIDRTFDMAARQVRGATTDLAKQLGVDLSQQLAGVKVSLGKLQLSADSAEAQQQLESYLAGMTDRLYTEAVKAAGFGGQLDGYFESADVFTALSASIALAVGNADQLGRALNSMEIEKVNKAVDYFQDLAGVAGTDLATQIQKVSGLLGNYASLMADVSTQLLTGDLTKYQSQALTIERTYRQQVKAANDYAKALGLSGARAEDLAKIEALRATNMGKLQAQIEADKKAINYGLSISELSTLTDQEKLQETMRELERAVSGGDSSAAQAAAQAALGFGRNLYASGKDYNALYGQVTGLVDGMKVGDLDKDGVGMGELADAIEALPDNFSRAVFDLVVDGKGQAETAAAVRESNALLTDVRSLLTSIASSTGATASVTSSSALRSSLNTAKVR